MKESGMIVARITQKYTFILVLTMLVLGWLSEPCHAALNMDEIRYLFEKETGGQWDKATSEERKDYLSGIRDRPELQEEVEYEGKEIKPPVVKQKFEDFPLLQEKGEEKAPFAVRTSFEKETGVDWEDAAEKEQEKFWKDFIKKDEIRIREDEKRSREENRRKEQIKREQEKEKQAIEKKAKGREQARAKQLREEERKRQEEKRRLEKAKQKMEQMRTKSKSRR